MSGSSSSESFEDCKIHKLIADKLFDSYQYKDALNSYNLAIECFENYMDYTKPPRTPTTTKVVSNFIKKIQPKIKVIERLIVAKTKRNEYKLEELKKYTEEDWTELPLFDILRISDAYGIPISDKESNLENMKYKFYQNFLKKYNPELKNLQELELIVTVMITERKYDEVLKFLNVSPSIDEIIEKNVLNRVNSISLERVEKLTKHIGDDIIKAIDYCSYLIKLTKVQKNEIKKSLFDLFKKELERLEFIFHKGQSYRIKKLSLQEIGKIIRSLNVYLRHLIEGKTTVMGLVSFKNDDQCIYHVLQEWTFFKKTLENIDRMLNQNQNYISLIKE